MKVGIFGDSFCDTYDKCYKVDYKEYHWAYILSKMMGATEVDFCAEEGSSFYYTYKNVLKFGKKYDKIIVCVTSSERYPVKIVANHLIQPDGEWVPTTASIPKDLDKTTKDYITGWFLATDEDFINDIQEAFIKNLENTFNNIIFIPNFGNSFFADRLLRGNFWDSNQWNLHQYHDFFRRLINKKYDQSYELNGPDKMLCHLPTEWHPHLAKMIYNHIILGQELTREIFPLTDLNPDTYFSSSVPKSSGVS
jgi:hypothetical protein